jgi:CrcB protein
MPSVLITILGVAVMGGLGSAVRLMLSHWHGRLPWGILTGNTAASFVVGFTASAGFTQTLFATANGLAGSYFWATVLATGFAGGLSTFSSWAAQTIHLMGSGQQRAGFYNFALNLAFPVLAAIAGLILGSTLLK